MNLETKEQFTNASSLDTSCYLVAKYLEVKN